jgi:predicted aconitase with swiveling domain
MRRADDILATGAIVAEELYGRPVPLVEVDADVYLACTGADSIAVSADGELTLR